MNTTSENVNSFWSEKFFKITQVNEWRLVESQMSSEKNNKEPRSKNIILQSAIDPVFAGQISSKPKSKQIHF